MTIRQLWAPLALVACIGCGPNVDVAAEEEAIRSLSAHWLELNRQEDAAAIAALFAQDGTLLREDRPVASGRAAIQEALERAFVETNPDGGWSTDRVDVAASGDLAVEMGTWQDAVAEGRYMTLYRKVGEQWSVQADVSLDAGPDGGAPSWATQALATWYDRYNARDAQGLANLYTANAVVADARGRAAIIQHFRRNWAQLNETCTGGHDEFFVVGNVAVGAGRDVCTAPAANGGTTTTRYQWLAVHERQPNGTWLVVRDRGEPISG